MCTMTRTRYNCSRQSRGRQWQSMDDKKKRFACAAAGVAALPPSSLFHSHHGRSLVCRIYLAA